jgi:hypothetical protein
MADSYSCYFVFIRGYCFFLRGLEESPSLTRGLCPECTSAWLASPLVSLDLTQFPFKPATRA